MFFLTFNSSLPKVNLRGPERLLRSRRGETEQGRGCEWWWGGIADVQNAFRDLLNGINGWERRFSQVSFCLYTGVRLIFNGALVAEDREKIRLHGVVVHDAERRCTARYQDGQVYYVCCLSYFFSYRRTLDSRLSSWPLPPTHDMSNGRHIPPTILDLNISTPADLPTPTSTPAQRPAKAAKMVVYLGKTHEKVDALVRAAVLEGVEGNRVVVTSGRSPFLSARLSTHILCIPLVTSCDL